MVLKKRFIINLFIILIGVWTSASAITFEGFLTYLGNQEKSEQITNWYNFINNAYYNSTIDFSSWLNEWDSSADLIYVYNTSIRQNLAAEPQIYFVNLKNNNSQIYYNNNNSYIYFTGSQNFTKKTFTLNISGTGSTSVSGITNYTQPRLYVANLFTNFTSFIVKEDILYSDSNLTSPYTGFYYFNNNYSDMGFKYVDSPIKTSYSNQYIKLGEFIGNIDFTDVAIQFGFLTENNTMGQVLATYGYPGSPELNKLKITNNVLYIPSRLITSDSYAVSVVIGTTSYDKVLDIQFISASGTSGDYTFNVQDSTNNIIDNDNDNTDKIINSITKPYVPSGDYNITSGDFNLGITYTNPFNNLISEIINLLRVSLTGSQRIVNLGFLPILNNDYIINLDTNFKCPYNTETKIFIGTMINGAMLIGVIYFIISIIHNLTTGNLKNLAYEFNEEGEFFNWF